MDNNTNQLRDITAYTLKQTQHRPIKKEKQKLKDDKEALILFFKGHVGYGKYAEATQTLNLIYTHHRNNLTAEESASLTTLYASYTTRSDTAHPLLESARGQTIASTQAPVITSSNACKK